MTNRLNRIKKLRKKAYRDAYSAQHLRTGIAFQIKEMRQARGWTQMQLAQMINPDAQNQSAISRVENPAYEGVSLSTLEKIARAFDVVPFFRFISYSRFLDEIDDVSPASLAPKQYADDTICSDQHSLEIKHISFHSAPLTSARNIVEHTKVGDADDLRSSYTDELIYD